MKSAYVDPRPVLAADMLSSDFEQRIIQYLLTVRKWSPERVRNRQIRIKSRRKNFDNKVCVWVKGNRPTFLPLSLILKKAKPVAGASKSTSQSIPTQSQSQSRAAGFSNVSREDKKADTAPVIKILSRKSKARVARGFGALVQGKSEPTKPAKYHHSQVNGFLKEEIDWCEQHRDSALCREFERYLKRDGFDYGVAYYRTHYRERMIEATIKDDEELALINAFTDYRDGKCKNLGFDDLSELVHYRGEHLDMMGLFAPVISMDDGIKSVIADVLYATVPERVMLLSGDNLDRSEMMSREVYASSIAGHLMGILKHCCGSRHLPRISKDSLRAFIADLMPIGSDKRKREVAVWDGVDVIWSNFLDVLNNKSDIDYQVNYLEEECRVFVELPDTTRQLIAVGVDNRYWYAD